jgi:hypothetical protein
MSSAEQCLVRLIRECAPDGAAALFRVFENEELSALRGGSTSAARLAWLIRTTTGRPHTLPVPGMCMRYYWGNDAGLAEEFRDSQFDACWRMAGVKQPFDASNQIGHFLTAVALSTLPIYKLFQAGMRLTIGHEKRSDQPAGVPEAVVAILQLFAANESDVDLFRRAVALDIELDTTSGAQAANLRNERDRLLWKILAFDDSVPFEGIDPRRAGNSLQDLRLSLKGQRFASWMAVHDKTPPSEAACWLRMQLSPSKPTA